MAISNPRYPPGRRILARQRPIFSKWQSSTAEAGVLACWSSRSQVIGRDAVVAGDTAAIICPWASRSISVAGAAVVLKRVHETGTEAEVGRSWGCGRIVVERQDGSTLCGC